jgi:hypothetical protein
MRKQFHWMVWLHQRQNNPQLKCMMPTFKVWMLRQRAQKLDATTNYTGLFMTHDVSGRRDEMNPGMGLICLALQMIPNAAKLNADSDYMNAMSSVEAENKNYN